MNKQIIIFFILYFQIIFAESGNFIIQGLGRSVIKNKSLSGRIVNENTTRFLSGGYTFADSRFIFSPNEYTRIHTVFRFKNIMGGFWGEGNSVEFREFHAEGIVSKIFKYEIGDIDVEYTPFTIFNDDFTVGIEPEIFSIRRDFKNYENFNIKNNWRLQGLRGTINLNLDTYFNTGKFTSFVAQLNNKSNGKNIRLIKGSQINLYSGKKIDLGGQVVQLTDIKETMISDDFVSNYVFSYDVNWNDNILSNPINIAIESGLSRFFLNNVLQKSDWFVDLEFNVAIFEKFNYLFGYLNVGPNFISPSAQSRRLDYNGENLDFPIISSPNSPNILNKLTNTLFSNQLISFNHLEYDIRTENIAPHGKATSNRIGILSSIKGDFSGIKLIISGNWYNEIIGIGTTHLRNFSSLSVEGKINTLDFLNKKSVLTFSINQFNTDRNGNISKKINLNNTLYQAGFDIDLVNNFSLLGGFQKLVSNGNEFISQYDAPLQIMGYENIKIDSDEYIFSTGFKLNVNKNTFFLFTINQIIFDDYLIIENSYKLDEMFLVYTMEF